VTVKKPRKEGLLTYSTKDLKTTKDPINMSYSSTGSAMTNGSLDQMATAPHDLSYDTRFTDGEEMDNSTNKLNKGPQRARHYRLSSRVDYQPDVCKDYKDSGYCGYGESCKFVHDRGDYKSGWELERDWENMMKKKKDGTLHLDDPNQYLIKDDDEMYPDCCPICKNDFTRPIITKCGHYFCEDCAVEHHSKSRTCFLCKEKTGGVFNEASNFVKYLEKKEQEKGEDGEGEDNDGENNEEKSESGGESEVSEDEEEKKKEGRMYICCR